MTSVATQKKLNSVHANVDNVVDFSAWLSEQELSEERVKALKNDGKYTLIELINEYNWQLEETDE